MNQTTHNVRRANWLAVITQCQERPEGISVKQWISENGVKEKAYYYWLRKFRKEAYEQMQPPVANENPAAVIRYNGVSIGISNEISDSLLSRILREVSHA